MIDVSIKGDDEVTQALLDLEAGAEKIRKAAKKLGRLGVHVSIYTDRWNLKSNGVATYDNDEIPANSGN